METRRSTGSLSSLTGSGTFTPPMSPRVESPRAAAAVGEKRQGSGKGIQMQIQQLANEQERVQKKTFTNWMNTYLKQKNMKVENLFEDIKDGVYLLSLLEALSGEKLQMERGKLKRVHHVSNISTALKFLEMKKIKLVNINVSDIADGKPSIVLGLIWTIILYFQIEDTFAQQEHDPDKPLSALEKFRMNAKKALLAWTGNAITKKYGIKISDFGKSWRDGLAFNAIVHTIRPDLIDFENVRNQSARANLEQAFSTAEDHLGIARLLDPEDVDVEKPDEKSIMTYVAQFLKAYPEAGEDPALGRRSKDPATQEMNDYTDLMTWLSAEAEEVLQIVDQPVTDRQQEYMDYLAFKAELDRREAVYKKLEEKCLAKKALKITEPMWTDLHTKWHSAARRTRMWLWKLDASLPGKLGKFGDWLNQGEEVLEQQPEDVQDRNDLAQKLAKLLQESAEYFKDAESWKTFFYEVKRAGKYEGEFLIQPQMDSLANRLTALLKEYPRREKRLAFEECQQKVLALRESAEAKLQVWTEKLGQQEDVELMLEDYNDFVNTQQLFHKYNSLSTDLSKKADVWKKSAGKEREQEVKKFIEEENTQWKKVSEDIKNVLPNLEKGLENWKLYNNGIETLTSFINEGESVMSRSAEEKQQHFSETPENEEKLRQVNDSGNFLMEVCSEPIADEIRQTLASLNAEFKTVTESFEEFKRVEIIGKGKQEYAEGVNRISEWLKNAEELMMQPVPCIHANLKDHLQDLTMCSSQIPEMENDFKSTTKTAQSLVKDSSPDVVSEMLQTLNVQKEVIVRLRKEIPERIKYLKAMLPNVENLETGISDLGIWLDKGDTVLSANKMEGSQFRAEERLEKHKAFFQETTYQKSIVESKNKVHQKVTSTKPKLKNVDFSPVDDPMSAVNQRFQESIVCAKDWEKRLENLCRLWKIHQQKETGVENWLQQATAILQEKTDDPEASIKRHKAFFGKQNNKILEDFLRAGQDILDVLEKPDQAELQKSMDDIKTRWKAIHVEAPLCLLKLEFLLPEEKFVSSVQEAEKTLQQEKQQLQRKQNVKETLKKHKQIFNEGPFRPTCIKCLETMQKLAENVNQLEPKDHSLEDRYEDHRARWEKLLSSMDNICLDLKQLPERWKDYNQKLDEFAANVATIQDLMTELQKEDLTSEEYKDLQSKYQKALRNMAKLTDDGKWLQENLNELIEDSPESDTKKEQKRLTDLLSKFSELQPNLNKVADKSTVFSKAYDFRDTLEKRNNWLDETQRLVNDEPSIDGLEDARAYLQEHENIMMKLESEKHNVQADLEAGKQLQREKNAPTFVAQQVSELDKKWKETNEKAKAKHQALKQKVQEWEQYETEKQKLLQYLKEAEKELEKPTATTGQDLAEKDLNSKKEMQKTLTKLKSSLSDMQKLNEALCSGASRERRGPLKGEMTDIDKRLDSVSARLSAKLGDLESTIAKWTEYYKRLNHFCDWLNEKEAKLNEVYENKSDSPEQQLQKAKAIAGEVAENHITLENLEKDARGMSQNFRSRETSALKTKLSSVRRQWESLCSRAKDRSSALTGSVAHWQMYQNLNQQLMPWIEKAEKYCATELPKCSSVEEAQDIHELHQAFVHECEEQFPVFEKLNTEAGYLMEQPNMQQDIEALQKRWNNIISSSEDRSHKADKMHGAWSAFDQEISNFDEILEKFQNKLSEEPNVSSTDVQVLEHELALCKNLQEEIKSQQPHLNALQRQFEQVKQHASPEGTKALMSKLDAVKTAYADVAENAAERQAILLNAVKHRQQFYGQFQDFEKWLKKSQRKLDSGNEIYADEVPEMQLKLKALKEDSEAQEPKFSQLKQEFTDLIQNCPEDEAAILRERYDHMMTNYSKLDDLIKNREEICENWSKYAADHKDTQAKLKMLQAKLASPEIQQDEVDKINKEVAAIRKSMSPWNKQANKLDDQMGSAHLVLKDRATQRTLHFNSELHNLEAMCDNVCANVQTKQGHLSELSQLWEEFGNRKDSLRAELQELAERVGGAAVNASSLSGLKELVRETEDARDDLYSHSQEYEQLRELGRQIMNSDLSRGSSVQGHLSEISKAWEHLTNLLGQKHQQYSGTANLWQQYVDAKQNVGRVMESVTPLVKQDITCKSQPEVKKALDQHKNAEFELHANQTQLDQMNNRGLQLLEDLKNVPNFDVTVLEQDLDSVNHKWESSSEVIEQHKENLEAQLICWDQIMSGKEEVESWLNTMSTRLEDSLQNFDDAITVESCLMKFKDESPYYTDVLHEVQQKMQDLQELNNSKAIPSLTEASKTLQDQFDNATAMAGQLENVIANFSDEREGLQKAIEQETEWLNQMKDKLGHCDDVSGSDADIVKRLAHCKELQKDLAVRERNFDALIEKTTMLQDKYQSAETQNLAKDAVVLMKKYEAVKNRGDKIADLLAASLEQHCQDAQVQEQRWINATKEKVAWCGDIAGDRYSMEAKLATVKDLLQSVNEGEKKKDLAAARVNMAKSVLPHDKQAELEKQKKKAEKDWNELIDLIEKTQVKLEGSVDQLSAYDSKYEKLAKWLKDTEAKVRNESTLKADLSSKVDQSELFTEIHMDIENHKPEFHDLQNDSQNISKSSGDGRAATYATQLCNRYQNLAATVKEQVDRCDQNVDEHEDYQHRMRACDDWLKNAHLQLNEMKDKPADQETLQAKLQAVEDLMEAKEEGLGLFNAALESGEKLFPNTSNDGRETIRHELRSLRENWELFNDSLNDTQRSLESSRMQWSTFDENYDQLLKWVTDMGCQIEHDNELRNTLQEKKAMLQHCRTRCQDIMSHQTMIDSVTDKGTALSSAQVKGKLKELANSYKSLCHTAQAQVKTAEQQVDQHQNFADSYQQCKDWITMTKDKLAVCNEVSGDKQTLQNRLDRVKDLTSSLRNGEKKIQAAISQAEKTLQETASFGQEQIKSELESLTLDFESLVTKLGDAETSLTHALQGLQAYDKSCDALSKWLRNVELQIKDQDLKSTCQEKQSQVNKFKHLQEEVHNQQVAFEELQKMAAQVQGADSRLVSLCTQLNTRYQTAKTSLRDLIHKLQDNVHEHEAYNENFSECAEWVNTLARRLQVCADMAGDKHDVEDRLAKLQELLAEKEQGSSKIHYTVDSGEKLYPNTASEGRDIIRQELRTLRDQWEQVCDLLSDTQHKLDSCLLQWSSYDENFEQFQKWLLDTEIQLKEDTDLKSTLPDKKAQLQNHRILHQDIMSRKHVMDNLADKAVNLTRSTPSAKVNRFVDELQSKYSKLCSMSQQMLGKLEESVKDHQQYQDVYQDCQDWLNSAREKVDTCSDTSGDKLSLQNKLERLKECQEKIPDGEKKLKKTKELASKTASNSSQNGQEALKRECDHLESDWQDYLARISQAEDDIKTALVTWGDFETKFTSCSAWLKQMEEQVKNYELKNTLQEKQNQIEKFKKQREEVLSHQPEIDRFTDDAQNLMHTSSDARLSTQVSNLTNRYRGLLSLIKDLIGKWEKYTQDHYTFDKRLEEFNSWLSNAEVKLDSCQIPATDQETMEEQRTVIQLMMSDKEHGLQRLNTAIEAGEKLYTDTAASGREKVRQNLRQAKEDWDRLNSNLHDAQRRVDSFLMQWSSYSDGQDQLMKWMADTENQLQSDVDLKNTLQEKRMQLQNVRSLLQDISSHQRMVDSVVEKAQGVLQATNNPEVAAFITEISSRYEHIARTAKEHIRQYEQNVQDHQQYHDASQALVDWLTLMKDRFSLCSDTSGDSHTLQSKLDRVQELLVLLPEGLSKMKMCENSGTRSKDTTALQGRQNMQQEMDMLKSDWETYASSVRSLKENLERAIQQWGRYDNQHHKILAWIKDMEKRVKDFPLKSTLEEKQQQYGRYQEIMTDMKSHQHDLDKFGDEAQTLQQMTGESRVATSVSQLTSRYQTIQHNVKDILKKCEQNVSDHRNYLEKQSDCAQWLIKAKEKFDANADTIGSRSELEEKLEQIQELVAERDAGFGKLSSAVESGEKLYPNTAADGREVIRQELRALKLEWESLFDDLSAAQRKLEVALVQWTSFDDSYGQVEHWLCDMESQLEGQTPLRSTLEEKKSLLQSYKVLHQDVLSYQRVIDSVSDKAQSLVHSSSDPQLSKFVTQARARYHKLCTAAKEHVHDFEQYVADHQQYNDAYNSCVEWLNNIQEKLLVCADVAGDRHTIQSRLDKIQDIVATKMEGEPKVRNVLELAEKVIPNTAPQGKEIVMRETDALHRDWEAFVNALQKTKVDLENCMDQWKEFETWQDKVSSWLKDLEARVRDTELKATLKEKQTQLDRLKHIHRDLIEHQGDIDSLSDTAQDLVRVSSDTRVISQASQTGTKYQVIYTNVKELCRRWDQYVLDHQAYNSSFDQCKNWLGEMRRKLQHLSDTSGDRRVIQDRLSLVQELVSDKEEGLHMLQISLDNLQIVLPNTSVAGRDSMRREMQVLQSEYDGLSADINDLKTKLDSTLTQWTVYDDSIEQLGRWLRDLEDQLEAESQLQNTLQEKKLQQERVKVQQLNIASQQSTIDNLNDKAENLKATSKDLNLGNQIKQLVYRYEKLLENVKKLMNRCEKNVKDHQVYRDTFMEASDWLSCMVDRLNLCSDVRGDRTVVEAQLHKLQDIFANMDSGKERLENTLAKSDLVLPETSHQGQDLIQEELNMLTTEYDGFSQDCEDLQDTLEKLLAEWLRYEDEYGELIQWMKTTENSMKAESELKASLEEKTIQYEKQNAIQEKITSKQEAFDSLAERAQTLLQSTTDNRVTSQLTQLSSRYTSLIASSKELMKRYEQHTMDHQHYAEAYSDAARWLQTNRERLSVCADTTGDRQKIQTQLEKLQEFVVVKEEGQLQINTASTWGEKTMNNTSMEGREMIRKELQQLQQEWDNMISEVMDTKVMLESCLLQWSDYSDSYEKIQKWLRDMEKRLRETEPKADLGEKKTELQRLKSIYQDVVSYEPMIESVRAKADDLATNSPISKSTTDTSQILNKYQIIKDQAMDMLSKSERCVAQHQTYHDSCNSFVHWLRAAREKLATCSDTFGEKSTIMGKIERAKGLAADLGEGTQRLNDATKTGENTLSSTSPSGQTKIRKELSVMKRDFEEYHVMLKEAQDDLERCLSRWNEFEDSYNQFNSWLKETETYLRSDLDLKSNLDEKKKHWEQYQNYMEEVLTHQSSLDRVNERAQALLQTNADAKTSHAITQLTTRYHSVISMSKDIVKNLELFYENHMNYNQSCTDFQTWLTETKQALRNVHDLSGTKDDVDGKLGQILDLQAALDQGHCYLRSLLENSERTLPNTSQRGCHMIRQETDKAKSEYENLLTDVSQGKRNLESALSQWGDFDRCYEQLSSWLTEVENKLKTDVELRVDLPEKRSSLERYKAIQNDLAAHQDSLDRLEDKADQLKDMRPRSMVADLKLRFTRLTGLAREKVVCFDEQVQGHEEYRRAYIACLDWLANNRHRLQRLSDYSGDKKILQDRLQQLKDFKGEMRQGQDMVNNATQQGERVMATTAPRGQEAIVKEIQNLKDDWNTFASSVNEMESNLESCIGNWDDLDEEYQRFLQWIDRMDSRIKGLMENKPDEQRKQQQLMEGEDIFEEILKKKMNLENVKECGDAVCQRSTDPKVSNNMMQLSVKYQGLVSQAKNMIQKLSENARDHKMYNEAFDSAAHWLADMDERVTACNDTCGDWHSIQERIEDIKDITASMDEGLQKVNLVCDLAERILPNTSSDGKRLIEQQVTELTNEWEKLNMAISECSSMLEGVQDRWNDYEEYYGSLVKWLADMENTLYAEPEPKAQLVEKKTQLDKYKLVLSDVENHHRLVNELAERVANLEALSENPEVSNSLADVQNRYDKVLNRAREVVANLERSYHDHLDFHESQQESEKWLLQISFKLMSHNSLNVSSMELTQRQIDKHRALIKEIEDYRRTLDNVNKRGRHLMDDNVRVPKLAQQIQSQLQNLEESYLNLQSTAEQIRVRLDEILQKWCHYKGLLERDKQFFNEEFPLWVKDIDKSIPDNLHDAQCKLKTVREMWERLASMKQEHAMAASQCEYIGESNDKQDDGSIGVEDSVSQLAEAVQEMVQDAIGETERRMNDIRDIIHQWETIDRTRNDLRNWLHSKQEDLHEIESRPSKLHPEAAELEIANLQVLREAVTAKGPEIDTFVNNYRDLTQHKPSLVDPVVRAVRDDWDELLGQIENLLEEREQALLESRELQDAQNTMDDDLEDFVKELEKIEAAEASLTDKVNQLKKRKCRSTQTPRGSTRRGTFFGSDDDDDDDDNDDNDDVFRWPSKQSLSRSQSKSSLKRQLPTLRPHRGKRPFDRSHDSLKKGSAAALDSESEESGYGETYYTMHASSFDNDAFDSVIETTMPGTPEQNHYSDNDSTVSYITGEFPSANPDDLRDATSQTHGNARTQTHSGLWNGSQRDISTQMPRAMETQTDGFSRYINRSTQSLQSIGAQTRRSNGSRTDLLKSILMEVKTMKSQRGLTSPSDNSQSPYGSDTSLKKGMLVDILTDVRTLKENGAHGETGTQTETEQSTQTGPRLFPEADPVRNARHGRLRELMDDVKELKSGNANSVAASPVADYRSQQTSAMGDPLEHSPLSNTVTPNRSSPIRFGATQPHATQDFQLPNSSITPNYGDIQYPGQRITMNDIHNINDRIQRLNNYQIPPRRTLPQPPPPPPPPPQFIVPVYASPPPRRVTFREFPRSFEDENDGFLSDESEYDGGIAPRRRRRRHTPTLERYGIEDALTEACSAAKQLRKMSQKMKDSLRDEFLHR